MDWNSDIRVGLFNALKCTNGNYGTHAFMELHTVVYIHSDRSSSVNNETLKKTITAQREHDCLIVFFFWYILNAAPLNPPAQRRVLTLNTDIPRSTLFEAY